MNEITRILEKLETASNLQKPGALNTAEFQQLRAFVREANSLRLDVTAATQKLNEAARLVGTLYTNSGNPY